MKDVEMREVRLSGETMFDGKVVHVVKDRVLCPNGAESYREIVRHNGGAAILVVTEDQKVLLERQFRYAYDEIIYEIPAGKLEKDENPYDAAMRELEEETGNKAESLEELIKLYPTCGYSSEIIHCYLAKNITPTQTHFDEDEVIVSEYIPMKDVLEMIEQGKIRDAKTIAAIMVYNLRNSNN